MPIRWWLIWCLQFHALVNNDGEFYGFTPNFYAWIWDALWISHFVDKLRTHLRRITPALLSPGGFYQTAYVKHCAWLVNFEAILIWESPQWQHTIDLRRLFHLVLNVYFCLTNFRMAFDERFIGIIASSAHYSKTILSLKSIMISTHITLALISFRLTNNWLLFRWRLHILSLFIGYCWDTDG